MVKIDFLVFSCILATCMAVAMGRHRHRIDAPTNAPVQAPEPSGGGGIDCSTIIFDMSDCLGFLTVGGTDNQPPKSCCSGFETVLKFNTECICAALEASAQMGIDVNMTRAKALPSACGVNNAPPLTNCKTSTSPSAPPGSSPSKPPTISPANPPASSHNPPVKSPAPSTKTPAPAIESPAPKASSIPAEAPAESPEAKSSGGHIIYASTLSTLFIVIVSVFA